MTTTHTPTQSVQREIGTAALAEFCAGLRGAAVLPGDAGYDEARSIWNGAHDRHPALIARCAGVADVIRTVTLARSEGLPLAVRGGGHSIPGFSTLDGGILLDLSPMAGIEVHPGDRTVTAQAGCSWKDLDADPSLVRASYPPETYRRLVEVKNKYDPTNLFRLNQNIVPTA